MNFPIAYHSRKDRRLLCANCNEHCELLNLEQWNDTASSWEPVPAESPEFASYVDDLARELS